MIRFSPLFAGVCLLFGACSSAGNAEDTADPQPPTAGAAGSGMAGSVGGQPVAGGGDRSVGGGADGVAGDASVGGSPSAGAIEVGGASAVGGAGAGGASASKIDFSIWSLQLPTGSVAAVDSKPSGDLMKGFANAYFYTSKEDGAQVLMVPEQGYGTGGSMHCRTELREMDKAGNEAAWTSKGTNTLTVTGKVTLLGGGSKRSVTIGQVFVSGSNTLCELQYNGSTMKVLYEESKGNSDPTVDLKTPIALNTPYKFVLGFSKGMLSVSINDQPAQYKKTPSSAVAADKFYFKVGDYDQTTTKLMSGTPSTTPYTQVEVSSVQVVHE